MREDPAVTDVALVDTDGGTRAEAQRAITNKPVRVYDTVPAMLAVESPAMAIVTFPSVETPPMIQAMLEAGVPVLTEKPACVRLEDFAPLVDLADRKQVPLMMALANRLAPWAIDAKRIVSEGGIGRLYAARAMTLADQTRIWEERTRDWSFSKVDAGGGYLIWLGIHFLDLLLHLTGERVAEVQAMIGLVGGAPIDVEDVATVNLRFASGAQASFSCGYVLDGNVKQIDLDMWGSEGSVRCNLNTRTLDWHGTSPHMQGVPNRRFTYEQPGGGYSPWVRECLRASLGEAPPPMTGADALAVLRVIFAAYESAATGKTVKL